MINLSKSQLVGLILGVATGTVVMVAIVNNRTEAKLAERKHACSTAANALKWMDSDNERSFGALLQLQSMINRLQLETCESHRIKPEHCPDVDLQPVTDQMEGNTWELKQKYLQMKLDNDCAELEKK